VGLETWVREFELSLTGEYWDRARTRFFNTKFMNIGTWRRAVMRQFAVCFEVGRSTIG
jgi:hypothetical protein